MLAALRWFETYVPKSLVSQLLHESAHSELKPEEREVTVMFTDIVGFSRIALRHAPGPLADFLNRHFGLIGRHVEAAHARSDKNNGDLVMTFGARRLRPGSPHLHAARPPLAIRRDAGRRQAPGQEDWHGASHRRLCRAAIV
jgi:class 3 adenylate cyclase